MNHPFDETVPMHLLDDHGNPRTSGFMPGDIVRHVSGGRLYLILQIPPLAVREETGESCYCLREMSQNSSPPDPRWWIWREDDVNNGSFRLQARHVDV